jgi:hypothetical protein
MTEPSHNRDLALFRRKYYWQYALLIAALIYLFFWDPLRNWWSFETSTVEISAVQQLCAAFERGKSIPLQVDQCDRLKDKMAGNPDIEIKPRTFVTFTYRSPVDNSTHSASIVRERDDAGQPVAIGSRIAVQLSRNEPKVFRVPQTP